jgi:hypothetical protein
MARLQVRRRLAKLALRHHQKSTCAVDAPESRPSSKEARNKPAAQGYETSQLLNGIAAKADVTTDVYVTSDWSDGGATVAVI